MFHFQSKVYNTTYFFLPKSDFISIPQQKSRSFDKFFVIIDNDGIDKDVEVLYGCQQKFIKFNESLEMVMESI
jgi:hypothetical protein